MKPTNHIAFKEWASVVEVLGRGEQSLILRKGGIHEKGRKFDAAHEEFFLFPTFEHQNPRDLKREAREILNKISVSPPVDVIPIRYYCVVQKSFWIPDEKTLERLAGLHVWSGECVRSRLHWGETKGLFGIVVRVYELPAAVNVPHQTRYGGCRSWVELAEAVPTAPLKPVLSESVFQRTLQEIDETLREFIPSK